MRERGEWRAALGMLPAIAGMGMSSGQAMALFFGQFGTTAWLGAMAASALFGALMAGAVWRGQAGSLHSDGLASACESLRLMVAAVTVTVMLSQLGDVGALALPLRHGYAFGAAFGALAALAFGGVHRRWVAGTVLLILLGGFYAACALDVRPVRSYAEGLAEFPLSGNPGAAVYFGGLFAAMNACAAAWSLAPGDTGALRPWRLGVKAGALMLSLLLLANLALLRGGEAVLVQPMPWVLLSARWGLAGFWLCAAMKALCAAATLSAALSALLSRLRRKSRQRTLALCMLIGAIVVFCIIAR